MIVTKVKKQPKLKKVEAAPLPSPVIPVIVLKDGCASQEQIRECAFQIYQSRGNDDGQDIQDWLHAELQLQSR